MRLGIALLAAALTTPLHPARAQSAAPAPLVAGSPDVSVGGAPAARQGDTSGDGAPVVAGSHDVFINGRPAVTAGARTACGGVVMGGGANVFINGKPLARAGDATSGCAPK